MENPGSLESQIGLKYDHFWNDSVLKADLKTMSISDFKNKLRIFDDTQLIDLVKDKRKKEAKKKAKDDDDSESKDEEKKMAEAFVAFIQSNKYKAKFSGKCNYCHIPRHKEEDCYKKKQEEGKDNGGPKCYKCGKRGHVAAKCWSKKGNQEANAMDSYFITNVENIDMEMAVADTKG